MSPRALVLTVALAAAVAVLGSAGDLPDRVASHFGVSGRADGFMPREFFLALMTLTASVLPAALWFLQVGSARRGRVRIPHAAHWLAPPQRSRTLAYLEWHAAAFSVVLAAFMVFVHWRVVLAHADGGAPPRLAPGPFFIGLGVFLVFTLAWALAPRRRFRVRPRASG
ncbi:MAG: DUF1648 domain-containing protein [Burkholderiales bacterium]|nr:DUF1648 domain-containing protein [Burkholderiales bacterium]